LILSNFSFTVLKKAKTSKNNLKDKVDNGESKAKENINSFKSIILLEEIKQK
jgi:hypothetical protein